MEYTATCKVKLSRCLVVSIYCLFFNQPFSHGQYVNNEPFAHTFSIVAVDPETGDMGIGVQSHWFSVGNTVAWGEAGVGIVATQAVVNLEFGPRGLALLQNGVNAQAVLDSLLKSDQGREMRQVAILDNKGNLAVNTGKACVGEAGHQKGKYYSVQANTAESSKVWTEMGKAFEVTSGSLADKMIAALKAGQTMGGDVRGKQSASLLIVRENRTGKPWLDKKVDLRVDDHPDPIGELKRLYQVHSAYNAMNIGFSKLGANDLESADKYFKEAQQLYPDNKEMMFWYAVELANQGVMDRALPIFKMVFADDEKWKAKILPRIVAAKVLNVSADTLKRITSL